MEHKPTIVTRHETPRELESHLLRALGRYWLTLREQRRMPQRKQVDPLMLPAAALPRLWMVDYDTAADVFHFRLTGEMVNEAFGCPLRGLTIQEVVPPDSAQIMQKRWARVAQQGEACYCVGTIYVENGRGGHGERLILPLSDDGGTVSHLIGITHYLPREEEDRFGRDHVVERFFPLDSLSLLCPVLVPS